MPYPPSKHTPMASMASRTTAPALPSNWRMVRKPEKTKAMAIMMNTNPIISCHNVRAGFRTAGTTKPKKRRPSWYARAPSR